MNLVLDLGNSRLKWARADPELQPGGAFAYGEDFAHSLDAGLGALARPARVLAVSVAGGARNEALAAWVARRWSLTLQWVTAQSSQLGVTNTYKEPARLGADRWAALIAARARLNGAACVVDCGSAVTLDALDAAGVFRGGAILPGLGLMRGALLAGTHGVRATEGDAGSCLAQATADGVAAGTLYGLAGAIDRILDEQAAALGVNPTVLITGGDGATLQPRLRHAAQIVPDLVLEGVARIAAHGKRA
jgi:type III pantothenate kinase